MDGLLGRSTNLNTLELLILAALYHSIPFPDPAYFGGRLEVINYPLVPSIFPKPASSQFLRFL